MPPSESELAKSWSNEWRRRPAARWQSNDLQVQSNEFQRIDIDSTNRTFDRRPAGENSARLPAEMNGRTRETAECDEDEDSTG